MAKANSKGMYANGRGKNTQQYFKAVHAIFDHPDYVSMNATPKALLWDLTRQFNGKNNGDLTLAPKTMEKWGWKKDTLQRHRNTLIDHGWIIITGCKKVRKGNCYLYALSWLEVNECNGKLFPDAYSHKPRSLRLSGSNLRLLKGSKAA
ncbi:hypothetical protein [Aliiglaciecola sp. NS0011-25]|uniref:hypothetical protein n=1 Tax=Aliiglaciecola sp. NS0011-25 TaxID=3127654 RepID=UPI00310C0B2D